MHHCTPLIVTNLGVMPEVIEHEVNGFVVKAGDYEAIEKRIQMIYSNNDQYLEFAITGK
jgi:glycosyltransferase involved in cell wall biosynthesis